MNTKPSLAILGFLIMLAGIAIVGTAVLGATGIVVAGGAHWSLGALLFIVGVLLLLAGGGSSIDGPHADDRAADAQMRGLGDD